MEPITVARKPLCGTVAETVLAHGTGALNIDGCRVGHDEDCRMMPAQVARDDRIIRQAGRWKPVLELKPESRWPANLIHDGGEDVLALLGSAARFFYCAKASKRDREEGCGPIGESARRMFASGGRTMRDGEWVETDSPPRPRRNNHPTVKPTDLMRYLCRLVTPPSGVVLDPFMGSGSTGKAAMLEGFRFVGIERDEEYLKIAEARIAHAARQERIAV